MSASGTGTPSRDDRRAILLAPGDDVAVAAVHLAAGETLVVGGRAVTLREPVGIGHKFARRDIRRGEKVRKYGAPIGSATRDIRTGEAVHTHNLASDYIPVHLVDEAGPGSPARGDGA